MNSLHSLSIIDHLKKIRSFPSFFPCLSPSLFFFIYLSTEKDEFTLESKFSWNLDRGHWGQVSSFPFISYLPPPPPFFSLSFFSSFFYTFSRKGEFSQEDPKDRQIYIYMHRIEGCETKEYVHTRRTHHFPSRSFQQDTAEWPKRFIGKSILRNRAS